MFKVCWQNNFTRKHSLPCLDQIRFHEAIQINNCKSLKKHHLHHLTHFEQHKTYPFFGWLPCCHGPTPTKMGEFHPQLAAIGAWSSVLVTCERSSWKKPTETFGLLANETSSWNGGVVVVFLGGWNQDGRLSADFSWAILLNHFGLTFWSHFECLVKTLCNYDSWVNNAHSEGVVAYGTHSRIDMPQKAALCKEVCTLVISKVKWSWKFTRKLVAFCLSQKHHRFRDVLKPLKRAHDLKPLCACSDVVGQ